MTASELAAWAASLAVVAVAVAWVRPVPVAAAGRPRLVDPARAPRGPRSVSCPRWFRSRAQLADLPGGVEQWWLGSIGAVCAAGLAGVVLGGPMLGVLSAAGVGGSGVAALVGARHRRDERLARGVPDTLDVVARSCRAGASVVQALAALDAPDATLSDRLFASVAHRVERGESLRHALESLFEATGVRAVRLAVAALLVGAETGAPAGRAVEGVAATLRDRAALDREAAANASQAKASVAVLVLAPLGFGLFAVATDPRVGEFLFRSWAGWMCLAAGLGLDAAGWWWMRSIMRNAR